MSANRPRWTPATIITAIRELAGQLDGTPSLRQAESALGSGIGPAAKRELGGWSAAVEAAGLSPRPRPIPRWTRETVIAAIRELAGQLGRTPTNRDAVEARLSGMMGLVYSPEFGSWPAACEAAGLVSAHDLWTERRDAASAASLERRRADAIRVLQAWAADLGHPPAARMGKRAGAPIFASTVEELFGSWNAGIEAAGLPVQKPGRPKAMTPEEVIAALQAWADELDRTPTYREATGPGVPVTSGMVERRFGSWTAGIEAAGLVTAAIPRRSREELIAALRAWAADLGRTPTAREADRAGAPTPKVTVKKAFGSWTAGVKAAGLTPVGYARK